MHSKQPLRSIKDVHSRLKWDGSIDTTAISIGYQDRMRGLVEIPFAEFRPGGRVPWDRIQYFRLGDSRIWDRLTRMDLVFGSGDTPANAPLITVPDEAVTGNGWPQLPCLLHAGTEGWSAANCASNDAPTRWKVLTLNLLADGFLPEDARNPQRLPQLIDWIVACDADLVCLQELDKEFLAQLLASPAVQAHYHVMHNQGQGRSRTHFEAILCKEPVLTVQAVLVDEDVRALLATVQLRTQRIHVACVHMFSELAANAAERRTHYLQAIVNGAPQGEPLLLIGDYNLREGVQVPALSDFEDAWLQLHPGEPGITFDGPQNALAQAISPHSGAHRLDRIYLRCPDRFPMVEHIERTEPTGPDGQVLSDHYALVASLCLQPSFGAMRTAPKTNHSACCIIPPAAVWQEIQALRRSHDTAFSRWMPHINLVYGFIPAPFFPEAAAALGAALADMPAFELTLEGFDTFVHGDSTTIYLKPDAAAIQTLRKVQAVANGLFPQCNDAQRHGVFNPHLTVAKIPHSRKKDVHRYMQEWNAAWEPITFTVDTLSLIARTDVSAFEVVEKVQLGGGKIADSARPDLAATLGKLGLLPGRIAGAARKAAMAQVAAGIARMGTDLCLLPTGSTALGTYLPGGDLDFLCLGRMEPAAFMELAPKRMEGMQFARVAANALVPSVKCYFPTFQADISYVQLPEQFPLTSPATWPAGLVQQLTTAQARALRAATDADLLLSAAGSQVAAFKVAATALKAWAEACRIKGNAFGYPGGFAWSLLLAQAGPHDTAEAWLAACLDRLVHHDWHGQLAGEPEAPMLLLSGESPAFNITRNVTEGSLATVRHEAEAALLHCWAVADGEADWTSLFAPVAIESLAQVRLRLQAPLRRDLEGCAGWLQSRIYDFVCRLEAIPGLALRQDAGFEEPQRLTLEYSVALLRAPDEAQRQRIEDLLSEVEEAFATSAQRPSGASLVTAIAWTAENPREFAKLMTDD